MDAPITPRAALLEALVAGPGFGIELIERVKQRTGGRLVLGQGTVYPILRDLEAEGLLDSYEGDPLPARGGRPRRDYRLTKSGTRAAIEQRDIVRGLFGAGEVPA